MPRGTGEHAQPIPLAIREIQISLAGDDHFHVTVSNVSREVDENPIGLAGNIPAAAPLASLHGDPGVAWRALAEIQVQHGLGGERTGRYGRDQRGNVEEARGNHHVVGAGWCIKLSIRK